MSVSGGTLVVTVAENQLINQVVFNGNRKIKDDKLQGIVQTQAQGPYSDSLISADIQPQAQQRVRDLGAAAPGAFTPGPHTRRTRVSAASA